MVDAFAALHLALFSALGEPITLQRGNDSPVSLMGIVRLGMINLGEFGRVATARTTVSLLHDQWQPRRGDRVTLRGNTYTVEAIAADDGYVVEAILHG